MGWVYVFGFKRFNNIFSIENALFTNRNLLWHCRYWDNSDDRLKMVNLISLKPSPSIKRNRLLFSKIELNIILSTYSNSVIKGFWKDYAIDQNGTISTFSIYKNSQEKSTFTLTKRRKGNSTILNFSLFYGSRVL